MRLLTISYRGENPPPPFPHTHTHMLTLFHTQATVKHRRHLNGIIDDLNGCKCSRKRDCDEISQQNNSWLNANI